MEHKRPHEIVNRLFEARDELRTHNVLENALVERISQLPEDNYCRSDIETLQLGAGYAHLIHEGRYLFEPVQLETEHTMAILQVFFAVRPINRYRHDHEVLEQQKQVHEAVMNPGIGLPDHLDPYEVSAAAMFLEGHMIVAAYYESYSINGAMIE